MQAKMKAIGVIGIGDYDKYKEVQVPKPTLTNPKDILVKVKGFAIDTYDYEVRHGEFPNTGTPEAPQILGQDGSGIIEQIGSDVKNFKVGDSVYFAGDATRQGNYADYVLIDHRIVAKKPTKTSFAETAAIPQAFITIYEALVTSAQISTDPKQNKGKSILVIGGAGGMGSIGIQFAKHYLGLTVVATASRPESREFVKTQGADFVIDYKKPLKEGLETTGIKEVDYTLVSSWLTEDYLKQTSEITKPFSKIIFLNVVQKPINIFSLLLKVQNLCCTNTFGRTIYGVEPERQGEILKLGAKLVDEGIIKHRAKVYSYSFEEFLKQERVLEDRKVIGKIAFEWK